jgi:hypothetical protein
MAEYPVSRSAFKCLLAVALRGVLVAARASGPLDLRRLVSAGPSVKTGRCCQRRPSLRSPPVPG